MPTGPPRKVNVYRVTPPPLPPGSDVVKRIIVPVVAGKDGDPIELPPDSGPVAVRIPQGATFSFRCYDSDGTNDSPEWKAPKQTAEDMWKPPAPGEYAIEAVGEEIDDEGKAAAAGPAPARKIGNVGSMPTGPTTPVGATGAGQPAAADPEPEPLPPRGLGPAE